jgi:TonB-linked SusC/RagA family outer membrane protein
MKKKYLEWLMALKKEYGIIRKGSALCVMMLFAFATAFAAVPQQGKLNLNAGNITYKQLFSEIHKQTGYVVMYNNADLDKNESLDVDFNDVELKEALESVLDEKGLTFQVKDDFIILEKKINAKPIQKEVKRKRIQGHVKDEQGIGLPGVSVIVKGTNIGTATNHEGFYQMAIPGNTKILVYSFIGMEAKEVNYNGQKVIDVILKADSEQMDEVVVTGYQTIDKGRSTGSFNIIKKDDLENIQSLDFKQKLEGVATGVSVDPNGKITIRGIGTISTSSEEMRGNAGASKTDPLIVVDGIPMEGSDININPDDIDQISILKDAASASIWGVRAANGVIVVTTKRAKSGDGLKINYSGYVSIEEKVDFDDLKLMSSEKFVNQEWNRYLKYGGSITNEYSPYNEIGEIYYKYDNNQLNFNQAKNLIDQLASYDNKKAREDLFYQNEIVQKHNISASVGGKKASSYLSLSYDHTDKYLKRNDIDKINFASNTDLKIAPKMKLGIGFKAAYSKQNLAPSDVSKMAPYISFIDENGNYVNEYKGVGQIYKNKLEAAGWNDWSYNRLFESKNADHYIEQNNLALNLKYDYEFLDGLKYNVTASYEKGFSENQNYENALSYASRNFVNTFTENGNADDPYIVENHAYNNGGILYNNQTTVTAYNIRHTLNYNKVIKDFGLNVLAGMELYSTETKSDNIIKYGYDDNSLLHADLNYKELREGVIGYNGSEQYLSSNNIDSKSKFLQKFLSYFTTVSLSYKDLYSFFVSARLDKTNMLVNSSDYTNNPSWSVSGKWNISNEDFYKGKFVNYLALKASYGLTGNIDKNTGPNMIGSLKQSGLFPGELYLGIQNPENPELGWEKTNTFNVGIDFAFHENKIHGGIEYYNKKSSDVLYNVSLDPTLGWSSITKNLATLRNEGIEFNLNAKVLEINDFSWNSSFNLSYNKNEVTEVDYIPTQHDIFVANPIQGQAMGYIATINYHGLDESGLQQISRNGNDEILSDADLATFSQNDYLYHGTTIAPYFGSFSNTFSYKDWSLSVFMTYKMGHKFLLPTYYGTSNYSIYADDSLIWNDEAGADNSNSIYPVPSGIYGRFSSQQSDIIYRNSNNVDKADIIRLKSINLAYNLNKLIGKNKIIRGGSVSLSGENLWYWAANKYDLDTDYLGAGLPNFPARKKFILNLKLNF